MKFEKEITVLVNCDYEALHQNLTDQGFNIVEEYQLNDIYLLPRNVQIMEEPVLELLKKCVLIRDIVDINKEIVYKYKEYAEDGTIVKQGKVKCAIENIDAAYQLMTAIGYKELIKINDKCIVYTNNQIEILVQLVNDKYVFIEMEDKAEHINKQFSNEEEMINEFEQLNIDYDKSNYYVKKAEIIFNDTYSSQLKR